ncbi:MAG: ATP-binding protein [Cyclobacteriaceae bacterium]
MSFRNLLFGPQGFQHEHQQRKAVLGGYLTLLYLAVDLFFYIVNFFNPDGHQLPLLLGFLVAAVCIVLIRLRRVELAMVLQLGRANAVAFYFTVMDESTYLTGTYLYFIPSSLGALAVYGKTERWKGVAFAFLSLSLFIIAMFVPSQYHPGDPHFYFISSYILVLSIGVLILVFYDDLASHFERKVTNKQRELEKTNHELDRFVYSVSHDLRAPLSSILGLVEVYRLTPNLAEKDHLVELIHERTRKLDQFIHDILDYARNARLGVTLTAVHVGQQLDQVLEGLDRMRHFEKVKFIRSFDPELLVHSDPVRLRIILNNLITNSIRYYNPHTDNPHVIIRASATDQTWTVVIEDNGLGIPAEIQNRVFEIFFKGTEHSTGSGLGLFIVKETVTALQGTIELQSTLGQGTIITMVFPQRLVPRLSN